MMAMSDMCMMGGMVLVVMMMLRLMMVMMLMLMMMGIHPDTVALSASNFLFLLVTAQSSAILLVPCAQRLAAKHEIVVFDNGDYHPCIAVCKLYLVDRLVWNVEVRNKHVGLANPARR